METPLKNPSYALAWALEIYFCFLLLPHERINSLLDSVGYEVHSFGQIPEAFIWAKILYKK